MNCTFKYLVMLRPMPDKGLKKLTYFSYDLINGTHLAMQWLRRSVPYGTVLTAERESEEAYYQQNSL